MNTLSYGLLGMLARKSCTGYELTKMLKLFWQAKHSQIYPLLAMLEQEKLVTCELIGQTGKPDKKLYTITEDGAAVLRCWIDDAPAGESIERDEFLLKVYAIGLVEPAIASRLFQERTAALMERLQRVEAELEIMEADPTIVKDPTSKQFGRYLLYRRKVGLLREELSWIEWVIPLINVNAEV
ncbi:PadR family transcriptional regulator [Paenibacillus sp. CF384]|uniref:PadR family transcriptional regulator n=1 Tax=Paenibacillus sp. CF384 TaxID=1884382 RepID=UPI00089D066C|nr:PadR family transcriptional regulator [Paenibacillus sp. CF384]SDW65800.1 DNA-binding transcriptional regulator, PadR family [Paenibacillus sp. CF384]